MPERRQKLRHATAQADLYVGLLGQITVDTTKSTVRVHDGSTPGGFETAKKDLSNVAAASASVDGKMTTTLFNNLAQVIADVAALDAADIDFDDTGLQVTALNVQAAIAAYDTIIAANKTSADNHAANSSNPHSVTKTQVGLANVTNDAQLKQDSNLADVNSASTSVTNLGIDPEADSAWTAGTSTTKQTTTPAKIRKSLQSFLNWPAGVEFMYGSSTPPAGALALNGQELSRTTYAALFAVYGTTHGAPTGSTFNLPDLRDRVSVGAGAGYIDGATGGADTKTLTVDNLPSGNIGSLTLAQKFGSNQGGANGWGIDSGSAGNATENIVSLGSDEAIDIRQKYIARNFMVTTGGV